MSWHPVADLWRYLPTHEMEKLVVKGREEINIPPLKAKYWYTVPDKPEENEEDKEEESD